METYRLKSRVLCGDTEYTIQTANDADLSAVTSTVIVNGVPVETVRSQHPSQVDSEEVLNLVKLRHGEAKRELEQLLDAYEKALAGGDPERLVALGVAFYYKGLHHDAAQLLTEAIEADADQHKAFNFLGLTLSALGRPADASRAAMEAVRLRPGFADYRNNLGLTHMATGACSRAVREFEEAINLNMYYADAYLNLGLALLLNAIRKEDSDLFEGVISKTREHFERSRLIQRDYETSTFHKGMEALGNGDLETAYDLICRVRDDHVENHRRQYSDFYLKSVLSFSGTSSETLNDRINFLRSEIAKNPHYVDLIAELGHCHLQKARLSWSQGLEQYRIALDKNPSLARSRRVLEEAERVYSAMSAALGRIGQEK